jgi:hypothetical protein
MATKTLISGAIVAAVCSAPAYALRPFEGTDASVAGPGELEVELGYLAYLREGAQNSVIAPAAVFNFGIESGNELVLEGRALTRLRPETGDRRRSVEDVAISLKQVHRNGVLQDASGPSIASECGVLVPTLRGERAGASCAGLLSERLNTVTLHFNAALGRSREGNWGRFLGLIVAGPGFGAVRPVFETFFVRDSLGQRTSSALAGLIWAVDESLSLDVGLRKARTGSVGVTEIRAGFTWSRPAHHERQITGERHGNFSVPHFSAAHYSRHR